MAIKKIILITGGSRGIGAATALLAAAEGYAVGVNYRNNRAAADAIVATIRQKGGEAVALQADVSNEQEVVDMFEQVERILGPLTALVNSAGIVDRHMPLTEMTAGRIRRILDVNVLGTMLCSREAVKRMAPRRNGSIVLISSGASKSGSPFEYIDYAASKGAIDTFTIGLAKEVAKDGIRVNAVRPGFIDTEIHASGGAPDRMQKVAGMVPMGRVGQAGEIAGAILWLLSDQASYTSGALVDVAGGK